MGSRQNLGSRDTFRVAVEPKFGLEGYFEGGVEAKFGLEGHFQGCC